MRVTVIVAALLGVFVADAAAQGMDWASATTACEAELAWATEFAGKNYSGFETKTAGHVEEYRRLVADLLREAASASDPGSCDALLGRWTSFFEDGHLSFGRGGTASSEPLAGERTGGEIRALFADWPTRPITESAARDSLTALGADRSPIEGVWESGDGAYRVAVLRAEESGGRYVMSILRADSVWWLPGQVKAELEEVQEGPLRIRFYMRDHSEESWTGRVDRNVLVMNGRSLWFRLYPVFPDDVVREEYLASLNLRFKASDAGPGTVLVQLPSFEDPVRMDSLFEAEGERIRSAERLVIDLRGNGGGSDYNYRQLIPLIYTDPIKITANAVLATEANIAANARLAADTTRPASIRETLGRQVEEMKTVQGGWYPFPDMVHEEPVVLERPSRVDVLVDGGCASSCEQFLLAARQSRKVTIYGTPTAGILDFGNVRRAEMPGSPLILYYPTTRSKRLPDAPVDGVGVLPDVHLPADESDPLAWVFRQGGG
jgi:hypothetical protein